MLKRWFRKFAIQIGLTAGILFLFLVGMMVSRQIPQVNALASHYFNPVTDTCWACLFPIKLGGIRITPGFSDTISTPGILVPPIVCECNIPIPPFIRPGVAMSMWEPLYIIEVVRDPFNFPFLGMSIPPPAGVFSPHGSAEVAAQGQGSFYQVHAIAYPVLTLLNLFTDLLCLSTKTVNMDYLTELDPTWNDSLLATLLAPEAVLVSNILGAIACIGDCLAETAALVPGTDSGAGLQVTDNLFWCAGCLGFNYPMDGQVAQSTNQIQDSSLLVSRMVARMHRVGLMMDTTNPLSVNGACQASPRPFMKHSQYKIQLIYPRPEPVGACCRFLGSPTHSYSYFQNFPVQGEDFGYLLWQKFECCAL
jgi:conjugal transfer pilus assembly protein TraU